MSGDRRYEDMRVLLDRATLPDMSGLKANDQVAVEPFEALLLHACGDDHENGMNVARGITSAWRTGVVRGRDAASGPVAALRAALRPGDGRGGGGTVAVAEATLALGPRAAALLAEADYGGGEGPKQDEIAKALFAAAKTNTSNVLASALGEKPVSTTRLPAINPAGAGEEVATNTPGVMPRPLLQPPLAHGGNNTPLETFAEHALTTVGVTGGMVDYRGGFASASIVPNASFAAAPPFPKDGPGPPAMPLPPPAEAPSFEFDSPAPPASTASAQAGLLGADAPFSGTTPALTGLEVLKSLAEKQMEKQSTREPFGGVPFGGVPFGGVPVGRLPETALTAPPTRALSGFATASMLNRAAENVKLAARSSRAVAAVTGAAPAESRGQRGDIGDAPSEGSRLYLGNIPKGISENLVMAECSKYGSVSSLFYNAQETNDLEGGWALVVFSTPEKAAFALQRLSRRVDIFGATAPLEVRQAVPEDDQRADAASANQSQQLGSFGLDSGGQSLVKGGSWPFERAASKDRREGGHVSRSRRPRSASRPRHHTLHRRRSRTRNCAGGGWGEPRADPVPAAAKPDAGGGSLGFMSSAQASAAPDAGGSVLPLVVTGASVARQAATGAAGQPGGGRQVGTRGEWAEFALSDGRSYYVHIRTGDKTWARPAGYDTVASWRGATGLPTPGGSASHSNIYVGGLPVGVTDVAFRQLFQSFGSIVSTKVVSELHYGFVKFASMTEAQKAIDAMNGMNCSGLTLQVRFANKQ